MTYVEPTSRLFNLKRKEYISATDNKRNSKYTQ